MQVPTRLNKNYIKLVLILPNYYSLLFFFLLLWINTKNIGIMDKQKKRNSSTHKFLLPRFSDNHPCIQCWLNLNTTQYCVQIRLIYDKNCQVIMTIVCIRLSYKIWIMCFFLALVPNLIPSEMSYQMTILVSQLLIKYNM